jgi:putative GTP pyrophosphokinase
VAAFAPIPGYSRSEIDRAGLALQEWWMDDSAEVTAVVVKAFAAMISFRETFQLPLKKTVMGLRSMVCSEWPELRGGNGRLPVVQRLKRQEQIVNKLARFSDSKLSNMGDIGGCRAVLANRSQVDGVVRRIRKNWAVHGKIRDTRDAPSPSGYRAVHVIVIRDGRRIEIQLRDPREHEWAVAVERTGARLDIGLKEGEGPDDLREYFRLASLGMYRDSLDEERDPDFDSSFAAIRERVRPYFRR